MSDLKNLFFYGTLRDEALLRSILGRASGGEPLTLLPAAASDRRAVLAGGAYPVLAAAPDRRLDGLVLSGASDSAIERLVAYEGPEYRLSPIRVTPLSQDLGSPELDAWAFEPVSQPPDGAPDWSYEAWLRSGAALRRAAASRLGALYDLADERAGGRADAESLRALTELWPDFLGEAARELGLSGPIRQAFGAPLDRAGVAESERQRVYDAFFKVDRVLLRRRTFQDQAIEGPDLDRAVFRMGAAVGVLPYDPDTDRIALIEQFRPGPWIEGDPHPWMVEIIAGRVETAKLSAVGDPAEQTARLEAMEEAGLTLGRLERFELGYASPGATDERFVLFVAEARLAPCDGAETGAVRRLGVYGLDEEAEDIQVFSIGLENALEALSAGEIRNLPAQLGLLWLARRRTQLQVLWSRPGPLD